jgi:serine/threonine protein kinase
MGAVVTLERKPLNTAEMSHVGPYRILRRLDSAGASALFEAVNERQPHRNVVVKTFAPHASQNQDAQWEEADRWLRVMNVVSELAMPPRVHAHLVRVTDAHIFADTAEGQRHYAVMEQLRGPSLETRLQKGKLSLAAIAEYALMIASALDSLHDAGVCHGNVTTDNILFGTETGNTLKLVGFGMSSLPLDRYPEAAETDRKALVQMVKHVLSGQLRTRELTEDGKRVILDAQDVKTKYRTATAFARAFRDALPAAAQTEDAPEEAEVKKSGRGASGDPPSFLNMPVIELPRPKVDKTRDGQKRKNPFWMLSL